MKLFQFEILSNISDPELKRFFLNELLDEEQTNDSYMESLRCELNPGKREEIISILLPLMGIERSVMDRLIKFVKDEYIEDLYAYLLETEGSELDQEVFSPFLGTPCIGQWLEEINGEIYFHYMESSDEYSWNTKLYNLFEEIVDILSNGL